MSSHSIQHTYEFAQYGLTRNGRAMVLIVLSELERKLSLVRTHSLSHVLSERLCIRGRHGLQPFAAIYRLLQKEGLIVLLRDPKYRKVSLIGLTQKGRDLIESESTQEGSIDFAVSEMPQHRAENDEYNAASSS